MDRSAVQWLRLQVETNAPALMYSASGRVYDVASTNPLYYYFPSVMVNCAGDMMLGFNGSSAVTNIGVFYAWQPAMGPTVASPRLIKMSQDLNAELTWGHYSATSLDPGDSTTFWTVQQYVENSDLRWATWIERVRKINN